jgi:uncharacterized membrane protein
MSDTARVEAFSDGVFAIAITLLILEIKVPQLDHGAGNGELVRALIALWPSYAAFLASFVAILIMWINHHGLFKHIHRVDSSLMFANGFLLLIVTFVPFPTAVLAEHLDREGANAAAVFYCGTFVLVNIAYNALWLAAFSRRRLAKPEVPDALLRRIRRAYHWAFPVYATATAVSAFHALTGFAVCSSLWVLWAALDYRSAKPSAE